MPYCETSPYRPGRVATSNTNAIISPRTQDLRQENRLHSRIQSTICSYQLVTVSRRNFQTQMAFEHEYSAIPASVASKDSTHLLRRWYSGSLRVIPQHSSLSTREHYTSRYRETLPSCDNIQNSSCSTPCDGSSSSRSSTPSTTQHPQSLPQNDAHRLSG